MPYERCHRYNARPYLINIVVQTKQTINICTRKKTMVQNFNANMYVSYNNANICKVCKSITNCQSIEIGYKCMTIPLTQRIKCFSSYKTQSSIFSVEIDEYFYIQYFVVIAIETYIRNRQFKKNYEILSDKSEEKKL